MFTFTPEPSSSPCAATSESRTNHQPSSQDPPRTSPVSSGTAHSPARHGGPSSPKRGCGARTAPGSTPVEPGALGFDGVQSALTPCTQIRTHVNQCQETLKLLNRAERPIAHEQRSTPKRPVAGGRTTLQ